MDSENDKNLKNDAWRLHHLNKTTSDKSHPYSKFSTGNKKTLMDIPQANNLDTREALLAFHKKYYSSHIMGLCILVRPRSPHVVAHVASWWFAAGIQAPCNQLIPTSCPLVTAFACSS